MLMEQTTSLFSVASFCRYRFQESHQLRSSSSCGFGMTYWLHWHLLQVPKKLHQLTASWHLWLVNMVLDTRSYQLARLSQLRFRSSSSSHYSVTSSADFLRAQLNSFGLNVCAVVFNLIAVPITRIFNDSLLRFKINVHDSKALVVTKCPFKVIH